MVVARRIGVSTAVRVGLVGLAVVVLVGALWGGPGTGWFHHDAGPHHGGWHVSGGAPPPELPGVAAIEVVATEMAFDPSVIRVTAGEPVNVRLVNDGQIVHDLTVPDLGFALEASAGERVSGGLTVEQPGTYEVLCTIVGHAQAGMRGYLVVESPTDE